jgi:hypothetical protein
MEIHLARLRRRAERRTPTGVGRAGRLMRKPAIRPRALEAAQFAPLTRNHNARRRRLPMRRFKQPLSKACISEIRHVLPHAKRISL